MPPWLQGRSSRKEQALKGNPRSRPRPIPIYSEGARPPRIERKDIILNDYYVGELRMHNEFDLAS
ncbi:hypothetical protein AC480_02605 [miscellaneous Crenarchaeota group archaeon SMTZ1-55]|nr:MAG: hypothetical protein AC480_02605 [miscellaneous Crenarchaeota group archaeon SMTZ1-55]